MYSKPRTVCVHRITPMLGISAIFAGLLLLSSLRAWGGGYQLGLGGGIEYYSGAQDQSLAAATGNDIRFGARFGPQDRFTWIGNFTYITSSSETYFKQNGVDTKESYQLTGGEIALGFRITPLARASHLAVQPFLGATGTMQLNYLKWPNRTTVALPAQRSDSQYFMGYTAFVGVDVFLTKRFGISVQVEQPAVSGTLDQQSFSTSSTRYLLLLIYDGSTSSASSSGD